MIGICTSITTTSNGAPARAAACTASTAARPSVACSTQQPQCSSIATAIIMLTGLSSAISARAPRRRAVSFASVLGGRCGGAVLGSGSSAQKLLPWPGVLSTPTVPPISCASSRQIERPRPVPPKRRVVDESPCENGVNKRACVSGGTPGPVSDTASRRPPASLQVASMRTWPRSVNLSALVMKFERICRTRTGSPRMCAGRRSSIAICSARPLTSASDS